jgi:hypothetical protein
MHAKPLRVLPNQRLVVDLRPLLWIQRFDQFSFILKHLS